MKTPDMIRRPAWATNEDVFEASHSAFPMMLTAEEYGVEWDALSTIAEQTDDPRDWERVADMESACDHQTFEGNW